MDKDVSRRHWLVPVSIAKWCPWQFSLRLQHCLIRLPILVVVLSMDEMSFDVLLLWPVHFYFHELSPLYNGGDELCKINYLLALCMFLKVSKRSFEYFKRLVQESTVGQQFVFKLFEGKCIGVTSQPAPQMHYVDEISNRYRLLCTYPETVAICQFSRVRGSVWINLRIPNSRAISQCKYYVSISLPIQWHVLPNRLRCWKYTLR